MALEDEMRDVSTMLSDIARTLDTTNRLLIELINRKAAPPTEDDDR